MITVNKAPLPGTVTIFIKTNGVHTDIVLPAKTGQIDWTRLTPFSHTHTIDTASLNWLAFGWGNRAFFLETPQWKDLKFSTAFNAAFGIGSTAMHATYYSQLTESKNCVRIQVSESQYEELVQYIKDSFKQDENGNPIYIQTNAQYGNTDAFYEGTGRYSMLRTCNTWANSALKSCGQKACLWTAFDKAIFSKYNN